MTTYPADLFARIGEIMFGYDLGELVSIERNERGTVNTNFAVEVERCGKREKYFLRQYKSSIHPAEIQYEHSIVRHLIQKKLEFIARVHQTRGGPTYLTAHEQEISNPVYYALFDFLPGEDRYTWVDPGCSLEEVRSAARILAQYHHAVFDLETEGYRSEPKIRDLLPLISENIARVHRRPANTTIERYLLENAGWLRSEIEKNCEFLGRSEELGCQQIVIHCDYHPGNLKFFKDQVVGLLDFDWSKQDLRCFDFALALWYFFTDWGGRKDGRIRIEDAANFLSVYQQELNKSEGLRPLSEEEFDLLPELIKSSNFYILNWALEDIFNKDVGPNEYLGYLRHNIHSLQWLNQADFSALRNH
jgi:homoserine kinase type II